jgi:hypothetical protein
MVELVGLLPADGTAITFEDFKQAAHEARVNISGWLRAKHQKLLHTYIDENGVLMVRREGE